ncbi:NACHT domain-containing protein, partial [Tessaracoccus sp. OH4464_COT-324]|uniref:phosphorylase family protein n=1 Tax=Tessaracoccus sp. OH4464_COT-324 TaxID=2491059 RepID=UPI00131A072E
MADALPDYAVRNYLARLALNETQVRQAAEIAGRLDSAGRVSVARLKEEVFPTVSQATANTNLTRLRKRINELSQELGLQFSMEITKAKRVGPAERHVWFEGLSAYSPTPATPELDAIPEGALLDTRGVESGVQPTAVLLTYNEHEARKLWQVFLSSEAAPPEEQRDDVTYYRLGQVGGFRVIHRRSEQGPYQAQASAARAIGHYNPDVLIAVGIAFGVAERKQRIGDVLVSRHVLDYELARVEPDGGTTHRGLPTAAAAELVARAETVDHAHRHLADWPTVHFGTVLSGAKLVDNKEYRDRLRELHTTVIGGEMEGVGVLAACAHEPVAAIVVKSVCDFAAHKDSPTKADDQRKAALTSARMVREILARGPLGGAVPRLRRENEGLRREIDRLRNPGLLAPGCPDVERMSSQSDKVLASELFIADVRGSRLSMGYHSSPADEADGTPVVEAMLDWARDGSAPQLFALLGEYGAGKTVSCQAFARRLAELRSADPTLPMPIYFNLKSVAEARLAENLEVLVATCMREDWLPKHCPGYTWEAFRSWLRQGPCVVIFDGLDELLVKLDAGGGQLLLSRLLGTLSLLPDAEANARVRLVLSCRTQYFQTLEKQRGFFRGNDRQDLAEDSYSALTLLPLSQRQVRGYLERALPGEEVDKVVALIAEVHNLPELAARPYTLGLLAEFAPELERRRAAGRQIRGVTLYGWTVEQWLARDEAKHFIRPGHKAAFMAELAAWLWRERRNAAPIEEVERVFRAWVRSDEDLSDIYRVGLGASERERLEEDLRTATFIARRDGERGSAFSFAHTSLQEYFLARYLFDAVRADQRQRWRMRIPARETLDFLGQLLAEADDPALAGTLARWKGSYLAEASELHAAYAILANREGYPAASLAGIDLAGARLDDWDFVGTPERPLDLAGARMGGASLRRAAFSHAKLSRADLGDANLAQAIVHACSAAHTRWPAAAPGAAWQEAGLLAPQDKPVAFVPGHTSGVTAAAWHPGGHRIATTSWDGSCIIWDPHTGQQLTRLTAHTRAVTAAAWHPDGHQLAT